MSDSESDMSSDMADYCTSTDFTESDDSSSASDLCLSDNYESDIVESDDEYIVSDSDHYVSEVEESSVDTNSTVSAIDYSSDLLLDYDSDDESDSQEEVRVKKKYYSAEMRAQRRGVRQLKEEEAWSLPASLFRRMFRCSKNAFQRLCSQIQPILERVRVGRGRPSSLSCRIRLMCLLRWLAGGSYFDICFAFSLPYNSFHNWVYGPVYPVAVALDALPELDIKLPMDNKQKMDEIVSNVPFFTLKTCLNI